MLIDWMISDSDSSVPVGVTAAAAKFGYIIPLIRTTTITKQSNIKHDT
jgi:hypothetical protein